MKSWANVKYRVFVATITSAATVSVAHHVFIRTISGANWFTEKMTAIRSIDIFLVDLLDLDIYVACVRVRTTVYTYGAPIMSVIALHLI